MGLETRFRKYFFDEEFVEIRIPEIIQNHPAINQKSIQNRPLEILGEALAGPAGSLEGAWGSKMAPRRNFEALGGALAVPRVPALVQLGPSIPQMGALTEKK